MLSAGHFIADQVEDLYATPQLPQQAPTSACPAMSSDRFQPD
jgi:hypothetical protein